VTDLLIYVVACFGFWWIVGRSGISLPVRVAIARRFLWPIELVECPGCFGFWTGVACGIVCAHRDALLTIVGSALVFGCATSASNLLLFSAAIRGIESLESPDRSGKE
jgi:hypothetical protein